MNKIAKLLFICFTLFFSCEEKRSLNFSSGNDSIKNISYQLVSLVDGLVSPVEMSHAGDERIFILEQPGKVRLIKNGQLVQQPFLDVSEKVISGIGYTERGLLGIAFHPKYKENGRFFIYYSSTSKVKGSDHKSVISEFKMSANPDQALPNEKIIMTFEQPESNHNGGKILFGPDGYLYIGTGDGGGGGDKHGAVGNAQNLSNLLGKILRIDVDSSVPYTIPKDNPFVYDEKAKGEIWAYGFRNPWKFSFDRKTSIMYAGDVGQNLYEEVDVVESGKNYGWRAMEGNHVYDEDLKIENAVKPIHDYPRNVGVTIIGGYIYRGKKYSDWEGKYFFADWSGKLFFLEQKTNGNWVRNIISLGLGEGFTINSLGEDMNGELYVLGQKDTGGNSKSGSIFKLVQN
jgi:glucose/arabinose dehydrogenase